MNKQKLISVLSVVLVLQLLLAAGLYWSGSSSNTGNANAKLLAFPIDEIDGLTISDGKTSVELSKVNQEWRLPALDFPAGAKKVSGMLGKLGTAEQGWAVATTDTAAKRFKVSDDEFERKITFRSGDKTKAVLYLGTSPSYRVEHARLDGQHKIYAIEFSTYDAGVKPDDWIDKEVLQQDANDISAVTLDNLQLEKQNGAWTLAGLKEDEQSNGEEIQSLVKKIANMRIDSVLGKEQKKEFGLDKPQHTLEIKLTDGKTVAYQISKVGKESYFALKSSALKDYLRVPGYVLNPILDTKREKLVKAKETKPASTTENQSK